MSFHRSHGNSPGTFAAHQNNMIPHPVDSSHPQLPTSPLLCQPPISAVSSGAFSQLSASCALNTSSNSAHSEQQQKCPAPKATSGEQQQQFFLQADPYRSPAVRSVDFPTSPSDCSATSEKKCNVFVSGLHPGVTDRDLQTHFERFGKVLSAKVMLHVNTGRSRGFGFILFANDESAAAAIDRLNGTFFGASVINVMISEHHGENLLVDSTKLYVRNIPVQLSEEEVVHHFKKFGEIASISFRSDRNPCCADLECRVALIEYSTSESARQCVNETHNSRPFSGCKVPVLAKLFEPQDLRTQRLRRRRNDIVMQNNPIPAMDGSGGVMNHPGGNVVLPGNNFSISSLAASSAPQLQHSFVSTSPQTITPIPLSPPPFQQFVSPMLSPQTFSPQPFPQQQQLVSVILVPQQQQQAQVNNGPQVTHSQFPAFYLGPEGGYAPTTVYTYPQVMQQQQQQQLQQPFYLFQNAH